MLRVGLPIFASLLLGALAGPASAVEPTPAAVEQRPAAAASAGCDLSAIPAAVEADTRMREKSECDKDDLALLSAAVKALDRCAGEVKPAPRWLFPVEGVSISDALGQQKGSGYQPARHIPCYAAKFPGHPAHDLFVPDPKEISRDKNGNPYKARAVEEGWVLSAHEGWKAGEESKGGNYVLLYLPARKLVAYYAHLESVAVKPGDHVLAGQAVGMVGRTGKNAWPRRSPTHLHFGLWDARFVPLDSYRMLLASDDSEPRPATGQ